MSSASCAFAISPRAHGTGGLGGGQEPHRTRRNHRVVRPELVADNRALSPATSPIGTRHEGRSVQLVPILGPDTLSQRRRMNS
jgi:hypothetical protein